MSELSGKVAIVTGSSRGIGEGIARRLGLAGAKVVVTARTVEVRDERLPGTVHTVTEAIKAAGGEATAVSANLQKKENREELVAAALDAYGQLHGHSPAAVTGKPVEMGGSSGRESATGRGVSYVLSEAARDMGLNTQGARIVVQGFGNVGS